MIDSPPRDRGKPCARTCPIPRVLQPRDRLADGDSTGPPGEAPLMTPERASRPRLRTVWMGALVTGLLLMNGALLYQNRALLSAEAHHITAPDLRPGDVIPPTLSGINVLDGEYSSLDLRTSRASTLLIYVSAHCQACLDSMERLREAASEASDDWQVVWFSVDPLPDARTFLGTYGITEHVMLAEVPWDLYLRLGLRRIPTVVAVGRDGAVQQIWHGRVYEDHLKEMIGHLAATPPTP